MEWGTCSTLPTRRPPRQPATSRARTASPSLRVRVLFETRFTRARTQLAGSPRRNRSKVTSGNIMAMSLCVWDGQLICTIERKKIEPFVFTRLGKRVGVGCDLNLATDQAIFHPGSVRLDWYRAAIVLIAHALSNVVFTRWRIAREDLEQPQRLAGQLIVNSLHYTSYSLGSKPSA